MAWTMSAPPARRWAGLAAGLLVGAALALAVLGGASAAAPASPAVGLIWHVNNALDDGLAGYWKFDEVSGTASLSSAPLAFLTTLSNGASFTSGVPLAVRIPDFRALHLDGLNDAAVVTDNTALNVPAASFSLAAWVRRATVNKYDALYDSGSEANKWWVFIADNGLNGSEPKANRFGFGVRGQYEVYSTRSITDTNWHHLALIKSGNGAANLTFYVDGVASGVVTATNVLTPIGSKRIGALLDGTMSAFFDGDIDEVRLYKKALSPAEVLRLAGGHGCVTDGANWPTAFTDLQCGIDEAGGLDEIWLAKSSIPYRPGTNRNASFRLLSPVSVFGGFAGTEATRGQRPPIDFDQALQSTLSGDLFGDDAGAAHLDDNSFNVVAAQLLTPGATLDGLVIRAGNANDPVIVALQNGGGLNITATSPALSNLRLTDNHADNRGGGLFATSRLTLTHVVFETNTAAFGGGADVEQNAFIDGGRFENNSTTVFDGGGLNVKGILILTGTAFISNSARFSGGGAAALTATVTNARFERNSTATFGGGGLSVNTTLTLVDSVFLSNTAGNPFGSDADGGGAQAGLAQVTGGLFQNNQSKNTTAILGGGGGLIANSAALTGTRFISNAASLDGGGLAVGAFSPGSVLLTGVVFLSNTARGGGGLAASGPVTASASLWTANSSSGAGGAALVSGSLSLDGARLEGNFGSSGGAVRMTGLTIITNTQFLANRSIFGNGGAIAVDHGGTRLTDIVFVGNQAGGQGGAMQLDSSDASLGQITAVSNSAMVSGSVLFVNSSDAEVANSIVWHNGLGVVGIQGSSLSFVFNLSDSGLAGTHNVAANPIFARDPNPGDGDWTTLADNDYGDLRLQPNSPGIDAGDNTKVLFGPARDLGGAPRFVDIPGVPDTGTGPAPIVDMGAYETQVTLFLPLVTK